ncbi:S-layer homology domain-containing protein [Priestia koreensis]|uniref:S-layer homology domain-containing protein n=1 Tax=Priestia koreensis TaxID=284581 RepID=UPI002041C529|nr:S-layer homology domain-containing protein [Priestia koreensis]MCM3004632.1 S-layer homology domain-containing protein [Priestia koreensis]
MKKIASSVAIGAMLLSGAPVIKDVQASTAVSATSALQMEVQDLINRGILKGVNGDYKLSEHVTRGQFVAFIARALDLPKGEGNFSDVPQNSALAKDIYSAYSSGIASGYTATTFEPNKDITREQAAYMVKKALDFQGVSEAKTAFAFSDMGQVREAFRPSILQVAAYGIIRGNSNGDGTYAFSPKELATRAQSAAFVSRMLNLIEHQTPEAPAERGIAYANTSGQALKIYKDENTNASVFLTSVADKTELSYELVKGNDAVVKVEVNGAVGYAKRSELQLTTADKVKLNYYKAENGVLYHYTYTSGAGISHRIEYGAVPSALKEGVVYYSPNGHDFYTKDGKAVTTSYQYFNQLSVRTTSAYTAEELNSYVKKYMDPSNPLANLGAAFKEAEANYHINALYLLSHAIHESTASGSKAMNATALQKKNLFGIGAFDGEAEKGMHTFATFEEGIQYYTALLNGSYLSYKAGNNFFAGAQPGNKAVGLNAHYATDPFWGEKIAGWMFEVDSALGKKDFGRYQIGVTKEPGANFRVAPTTSQSIAYEYQTVGTPFTVIGKTTAPDAGGHYWHEIQSDVIGVEKVYLRDDIGVVVPYAGMK